MNHSLSEQKFHIVFLDFDDIKNPLLSGGQASITLEVGKRMTAAGHRVTVISSKYPQYEDRWENGVHYRHVGLGTRNVRLNNLWYIPAALLAVRKIQADVIIECFTAPMSTLLTPLVTNIPVVGLSTFFEAEQFSKHYHLPFWIVEKYGLKRYKYFISYSEFYQKKAQQMNPGIYSQVIHLGVRENFFEIPRRTTKHILYLGRLDIRQKGLDILLRAYAGVTDSITYPLVIAGSGPDEQKVRSIIKNLGLGDKVRMAGLVRGKEKDDLLSEALCVAVPSRHETFCLSVLESLAAGAPVAAFDIPGIAWAKDELVLKARPYDEQEYGQVLLRLSAQNTSGAMAAACRNFAKGFTWDRVANQFISFIREVLPYEEGAKNVTYG